MKWVLLGLVAVAAYLFFYFSESFTDTEFTNVTRPCLCPATGECPSKCDAWESKISSVVPSTGTEIQSSLPYLVALQSFYDTVYVPAPQKPTEAEVDAFLTTPAGTPPVVAGQDTKAALKSVIMNGFHIDASGGKAAKEKAAAFPIISADLQPSNGRDEVYGKLNEKPVYVPAVPQSSTVFSEGDYAPVKQSTPRRPGGQ